MNQSLIEIVDKGTNADAERILAILVDDVFRSYPSDHDANLAAKDVTASRLLNAFIPYVCGRGHVGIEGFERIGKIEIGVSEIHSEPSSKFDLKNFVKSHVAIFHERAHCEQFINLSQSKTPLAKYITLSYAAGSFDDQFYSSNYFLLAHEMAAQYAGVRDSYANLCYLTGDTELATEWMLDYIHDRIRNNVDFVQHRGNDYSEGFAYKSEPTDDFKHYNSVEEYLDDLNERFREVANASFLSINKGMNVDECKKKLDEKIKPETDSNEVSIAKMSYRAYARMEQFDTGISQMIQAADTTFLQNYIHLGKNMSNYDEIIAVCNNVINSKPALNDFGFKMRNPNLLNRLFGSPAKVRNKNVDEHVIRVMKDTHKMEQQELPQRYIENFSLHDLPECDTDYDIMGVGSGGGGSSDRDPSDDW